MLPLPTTWKSENAQQKNRGNQENKFFFTAHSAKRFLANRATRKACNFLALSQFQFQLAFRVYVGLSVCLFVCLLSLSGKSCSDGCGCALNKFVDFAAGQCNNLQKWRQKNKNRWNNRNNNSRDDKYNDNNTEDKWQTVLKKLVDNILVFAHGINLTTTWRRLCRLQLFMSTSNLNFVSLCCLPHRIYGQRDELAKTMPIHSCKQFHFSFISLRVLLIKRAQGRRKRITSRKTTLVSGKQSQSLDLSTVQLQPCNRATGNSGKLIDI